MGCDIHLYIEYRKRGSTGQWNSFTRTINPGRNYFMFGILSAGVRCDPGFSYPAKGVPDGYGSYVHADYLLYINDSEGLGCATLEQAQRWAEYGSKIIELDGKPTWVTHPDWHSHSWLSTDEYKKALDYYNGYAESKPYYGPEPEYEAILAAMQRFEAIGYDARIIFWFDN